MKRATYDALAGILERVEALDARAARRLIQLAELRKDHLRMQAMCDDAALSALAAGPQCPDCSIRDAMVRFVSSKVTLDPIFSGVDADPLGAG